VSASRLPGEFQIIARYFAPLAAKAPGALGLTDDAALLDVPAGCRLVVTTDAMVSGVHFLPDDPADAVAAKLLRVNLSDLAAMGAEPVGYTLVVAFSPEIDEPWLAAFARGLAADQERFGIFLLGGDTVATPGPLTLSLTAMGTVPEGRELRRRGARPGDLVCVSGTIGDGALGLKVLRRQLPNLPAHLREFLAGRYRYPTPRLGLGARLRGVASAAMDISDGLIADLAHICETSEVAAVIEAEKVPLSEAARAALALDASLFVPAVLAGGDDYELLFTVSAGAADGLEKLAAAAGLPLTVIGRIEAGRGVTAVDRNGTALDTGAGGYRHF
jgi:thiamine-monophosphate kinase